MRHASGGLFSSLDVILKAKKASSISWEYREICDLIKTPEDIRLLELAFGISPQGNFEGKKFSSAPGNRIRRTRFRDLIPKMQRMKNAYKT